MAPVGDLLAVAVADLQAQRVAARVVQVPGRALRGGYAVEGAVFTIGRGGEERIAR